VLIAAALNRILIKMKTSVFLKAYSLVSKAMMAEESIGSRSRLDILKPSSSTDNEWACKNIDSKVVRYGWHGTNSRNQIQLAFQLLPNDKNSFLGLKICHTIDQGEMA
jgi:hypothetical protein